MSTCASRPHGRASQSRVLHQCPCRASRAASRTATLRCQIAQADLPLPPLLLRLLVNIRNLRAESFQGVATYEVAIADHSRVLSGIVTVTALEDLGQRTSRQDQWLRLQRTIMELVEVSAEFELFFRPDSFGHWRRLRLRRI